jgi:transmembrane sensor
MIRDDNQNDEFNDLLVKYLTGEASKDERNTARNWINENADHQKYFNELQEYYRLTKMSQNPSGFDKEKAWGRIRAGYYQHRYLESLNHKVSTKMKILRIGLPVAASVIFAFMLGFYLNNNKIGRSSPEVFYNEIKVPLGAKTQVILSDSTVIWLNAGSKLRYPSVFSSNSREVYLEGEAFFDVKKKNHEIFVVKTSNFKIKVYGTQFNVKSYPDEDLMQTTLLKGSVEIEKTGKLKQRVLLKPNQTVVFYRNDVDVKQVIQQKPKDIKENVEKICKNMYVSSKENNLPITSWKDPEWVIIGEELGNLSVELERRYNVKITFADESLKKYKFTGNLKDETFEQVLKIIQISAPIIYTVKCNQVEFKEDKLYKEKYDKMIQ